MIIYKIKYYTKKYKIAETRLFPCILEFRIHFLNLHYAKESVPRMLAIESKVNNTSDCETKILDRLSRKFGIS